MANILVISPTPSHPQDAGNRMRIFSLLSGLKVIGHRVFFAFVEMEAGDKAAMTETWDGFFPITYTRPAARWLKQKYDKWANRFKKGKVLPFRIDDWYPQEITQQLLEIRDSVKPDVVQVEYVFLSKALEIFDSSVLKVLDTHDIFGNRHKLYQQNAIVPQWFYTSLAGEKKALDRADVILAIQEKEEDYFRRLTDTVVISVGHMVQVSPNNEGFTSESNRLLFVGSANPINVDALSWFLAEVLPLVRSRLPDIELEAVGDCARKIPKAPGFIPTGSVPDLAPYYRRARIVINPVLFGIGLKIKTIEALAYGRPLVTTRVGAAGLEIWAGKAFFVADTPEEFVEAILKIFASPELSSKLSALSFGLVRQYNQTVLEPLANLLKQQSPVT